ncbi:MAG: response regulator [Armatimonadetes bacterium]|nr:response regulator [Armatimonadota bacterium]
MISRIDWSQNPLGPRPGWPPELHAAIAAALASPHPVWMSCGEDRVQLYNDACSLLLGPAHPRALGRTEPDCPSSFPTRIKAMVRKVRTTRQPAREENISWTIRHAAGVEDRFYRVEGVAISWPNAVQLTWTDVTRQVVAERRLAALQRLATGAPLGRCSWEKFYGFCASALKECSPDVPFALLYEVNATVRLKAAVGVERAVASSAWPLRKAIKSGRPILVENRKAVVLAASSGTPALVLVAGFEPRCPAECSSAEFASAVAQQLGILWERQQSNARVEATPTWRRVEKAVTAIMACENPALEHVLTALCRSLGAAVGEFWSRQGGELRLEMVVATRQRYAQLRQAASAAGPAADTSLVGRALSSSAPVWLADLDAVSTGCGRCRQAREAGLRAGLALPVRFGQELLGVLQFFTEGELAMDQDIAALLVGFGSELAQTLLRQKAEQTLRDALAQKEAILRSALDCVITMDADGRIIEFNPAAERTFGYRADQALGEPLVELLIPPAYRRAHEQGVLRFLDSGEAGLSGRRVKLRAMRADGSDFPVEIAVTCIENHGKPLFTAYLRDITERERDRRRLAEARDEAVRADRMKTVFLANVSHEIRTPMHGIQGMLELLSDTVLTPEQRDYVETTTECCRSLLSLLNEVLDLSRIEAGKLELHRRAFNLEQNVHRLFTLFRPLIEQSGLVLDVAVSEKLPARVSGDPDRLRQILTNLLTNALKFTRQGKIAVKVLACEDEMVRFEVSDTGIGIDPADLEVLWEPFIQADLSSSRQYQGAGLGLSIVRRLTELMGGRFGADSRLGEGSTFWVEIPFEIAADAEAAPDSAEHPPSHRPASPEGGRILLAEDNAINRRVLLLQLRKLGYEVDAVADGYGVLEALARQSYGLILMDCQMPGMDGYTASRRIRSSTGATRDLPIVAVTAHGLKDERLRAYAAGMNDYVRKPVSSSDLACTVRRWLGPPPSG